MTYSGRDMNAHAKTGATLIGATLALGAGGCATSVSTSSFKGEEREVAQTVANLQSDVSAADEKKVCGNDLAASVVARLNAAPGGCTQAVKSQLQEIDNLEAKVESVTLGPAKSGTRADRVTRTASAVVKSVYEGKGKLATVSLVKVGGKWKIAAVS